MKSFIITLSIIFISAALYFNSTPSSPKVTAPAKKPQTISAIPVNKSTGSSAPSTKVPSAAVTQPTTAPKSSQRTYTSNKSYSFNYSYDDGYEDLIDNDEIDYNRYYSNSDYADGVDDAADEFDLDW